MVMFGILFCFLLCRLLLWCWIFFLPFSNHLFLSFNYWFHIQPPALAFISFYLFLRIRLRPRMVYYITSMLFFIVFFMIFCFFLFADFERDSMMSLSLIWFDHLTLVLSLFDWIKRFLVRIFEPNKTRWWCINTDILCHSRFSTLETY